MKKTMLLAAFSFSLVALSIDQIGFTVLKKVKKSPENFTQCLIMEKNELWETSGLYGKSFLQKITWPLEKITHKEKLPSEIFAEGCTVLNKELFVITWREARALVFDASWKKVREFRYTGEGWGITNDGSSLYMSDGTAEITVRSPSTGESLRKFSVTMDGKPVSQLNELEWIDGFLWANIWQDSKIIKIHPTTGVVQGVLDLKSLESKERLSADQVVNGIAYHKKKKTIIVTGKLWKNYYELRLTGLKKS